MSYSFRPAKREQIPLLLGVAGGTGSGKTMSALRLARGIAAGQPFAGIDTENRRMNHYADRFPELHVAQITAPFRPETYTAAIEAGAAYLADQGVPSEQRVVLVDSFSHEWAGDGGCLDWHDEITGGDRKKSPAAWATIKPAHKRMVTRLLQLDAHVIVCLRAEDKIDIIREDGELKFVPKKSLTGLDGWIPISEKRFPFELTASFLLMADAPGVPQPIKLEEDHRPLVPLDRPLDEQVGAALAEWANGGEASQAEKPRRAPKPKPELEALTEQLLALADRLDQREATETAITSNRAKAEKGGALKEHATWLRRCIAAAEKSLEAGGGAGADGSGSAVSSPADGDSGGLPYGQIAERASKGRA